MTRPTIRETHERQRCRCAHMQPWKNRHILWSGHTKCWKIQIAHRCHRLGIAWTWLGAIRVTVRLSPRDLFAQEVLHIEYDAVGRFHLPYSCYEVFRVDIETIGASTRKDFLLNPSHPKKINFWKLHLGTTKLKPSNYLWLNAL